MNLHYSATRKIDPSQGSRLGDGTENNGNRVEIGPTPLAFEEWRKAGLQLPDLKLMREARHRRLTDAVVARGYGGLLMFDPLNIRYATDTTNMQLWNTHNPFRAVLLCADGYMVIWDYKNAPFLSGFNPLVREARSGADMFYFARGDRIGDGAKAFAAEVADLLETHAPGHRMIGVDKIQPHGLDALRAAGLEYRDGEEVTERTRAIKTEHELRAMRCAVHSCERAMAVMEDFARTEIPRGGVTENDVWAVLHAENIKRGGEWIETRLLTSGPRTNPWFQECGPREIAKDEILAFDTDLIGPYGICADLSRTWWIGDGPAPAHMRESYAEAVEHIRYNTSLLRPGLHMDELTSSLHVLRPKYQELKYSSPLHGVGMCDEWPLIAYPDRFVPGAFDAILEPGLTLCVEALVGEVGGDHMVKLEDQGVLTEDGYETISTYPHDKRFL
ncbi:dimethylsulfonioproprionate lyase DddP [Pontivivens insulae]|uniref:Dimethlysulfonioproprionate lyase DddP n=1 Tax=Pontivivens insulae TaxID=1639689 RepID=A0A2R8A915_9RHOB|nr:dimethylsulfonioproprionate lyase DddP [Pontivivens insulae]RED18821.1 dimethylsulfoniopropionate lyase DddP [Pontivivens insulae]SPF28721.1 Dimethlysulfonioproprionate lyase DddP [Pontivivens insulae]